MFASSSDSDLRSLRPCSRSGRSYGLPASQIAGAFGMSRRRQAAANGLDVRDAAVVLLRQIGHGLHCGVSEPARRITFDSDVGGFPSRAQPGRCLFEEGAGNRNAEGRVTPYGRPPIGPRVGLGDELRRDLTRSIPGASTGVSRYSPTGRRVWRVPPGRPPQARPPSAAGSRPPGSGWHRPQSPSPQTSPSSTQRRDMPIQAELAELFPRHAPLAPHRPDVRSQSY